MYGYLLKSIASHRVGNRPRHSEPHADLLLINEIDGQRAAKNAGVKVKGTIGVISDGIRRNLLTAGAAVEID